MGALKRIGKAFVVGAGTGLLGMAIIMVVGMFIPDATLVILVSMVVLSIVGYILVATGIYAKVAKFGGDGAAIPLIGLQNGAANIAAGARAQGMSGGRAFWQGFKTVIIILGIGFLISLAIGLFIH